MSFNSSSGLEYGVRLAVTALAFAFGFAVVCGVLFVIHFLITLPMRRAERARLFLDVLETSLESGQPVEQTMVSVSESRDLSMGVRFHLVAAWITQNLTLGAALAKVPRFLPPPVTAMLLAGEKIGDFRRVLPACRQLLKDGVSQTRAAISYLVILTLFITPAGTAIFRIVQVVVIPKFLEIAEGLGGDPSLVSFLHSHQVAVILIQCIVLLSVWLAAFAYLGGPRIVSWFPVLERLQYRVPWRRKRMQRNFSSMLAVLLDSGVPEPEAVTLAADCTANKALRRRAARAVESLQQGRKLPQAVQSMDDSGEFGWRLANACGTGGFLRALAGWHDALDAKAFQEEQAAAHGITTALVLWSGLFVGIVVVSIFTYLISIINEGVLW